MSLDLPSTTPLSARRRTRALCSLLAPLTACALLAAACGGDEATGDPDFGSGALGPFGGVGGGSSNPAAPPANNGTPVGNSNTPSTNGTPNNNNEPNQGNGTPTAGNNNNAGNNNGNNNAGNNNGTPGAGSGNNNNGAAGSGNNTPAGNAGAGGAPANPPPPAGAAGTGATQPPPPPPQGAAGSGATTPPPPPPPPAGPDIPCPAGATFCSGFENDALPAGASYQSNPQGVLQFDTAVKRSGNRSAMFPATGGGFNVREVITPIPGQAYWVRLFIQTDVQFGDNNHDSLFVGSTAAPAEDNNQEHGPEFSEQGNQVLLNADDALFSANGPGFPQGTGPQLAADTWHCVEAFFDGGSGDVQIFSDGDALIDAPGFKPLTYQTFRFGYIGFNTARTIWFDDVVVSSARVGCQ